MAHPDAGPSATDWTELCTADPALVVNQRSLPIPQPKEHLQASGTPRNPSLPESNSEANREKIAHSKPPAPFFCRLHFARH